MNLKLQLNQLDQINQLKSLTQSEKFKKMTEVIPDTKVSKNLTELDKVSMHQYVKSLKYKSGITQKEINEVFKLEGMEFLETAYNLAMNKLNIPENLRIGVNFIELPNPAMYQIGIEQISMDPSIINLPKPRIFNLLRHELQHYMQNLSIYRHENLGEEAAELYARTIRENSKIANESVMNKTKDELIQMGIPEEGIIQLGQLKELKQKDPKAYDEIYEENYRNNVVAINNFKDLVRNEMGIIKADSPEGKRAEGYYEEFKNMCNNNSYHKDNSGIDLNKYFATKVEDEAILAGERWEADVSGQCYYKTMKDATLGLMNGKISL